MAHIGCIQTIESVNLVTKIDSFQIPRMKGPPRGFGDLGRMAIYFQGAREHW